MTALPLLRAGARALICAGLLLTPGLLAGQAFPPQPLHFYKGRCDGAAAVPLLCDPVFGIAVTDTYGAAGVPDGAVSGWDVPCNTAADCGGLACFVGECTAPFAAVGFPCNVASVAVDCGAGGICDPLEEGNDTTLVCWDGVLPAPGTVADLYHGSLGPGSSKGEQADGVCVDGGIPSPAAAVAPAPFWMLDTNGPGALVTPWATCYGPLPTPGGGAYLPSSLRHRHRPLPMTSNSTFRARARPASAEPCSPTIPSTPSTSSLTTSLPSTRQGP
jgi:hypothetical protein